MCVCACVCVTMHLFHQASLESGGSLLEANPHDVAGLLKQYIRELPEPLTTRLLSPLFERCQRLANSSNYYTLLACLLLPEENLRVWRTLGYAPTV